MKFDLNKSIEILQQTPSVLEKFLGKLSDEWIYSNEGKETWSPYDIVGHLIHGEKTDWMPRLQIILRTSDNKNFEPFDRFAQFTESKGKSLELLLAEFRNLREKNLQTLKELNIRPDQLSMEGIHPVFGRVTLAQLLATWTVHDCNHIAQISRIMSFQYKEAVGPWIEFLAILNWERKKSM